MLAWRASRLSGIPDIGDPFDTDRLLAWKVPDERNAYVFYRKAHEAIHHDHEVEKTLPGYRGGAYTGQALSARETAYLEANTPALRLWREGTERPKAQYYRMAELNIVTPLDVVHSLRHFARLALLEGSRCESRGDMAGAWGWYRAVLRSSWHCGARGVLVERLIGDAHARGRPGAHPHVGGRSSGRCHAVTPGAGRPARGRGDGDADLGGDQGRVYLDQG